MADVLTKEQRRKNMQNIRCKDTKIEVILRKALWNKGYRYRKNYKKLPGNPDIVLTKYKIAIFCDGDFWHGKNFVEGKIATHTKYWDEKIQRNIERDLENTLLLRDNGWIVIRFWETDIKNDLASCVANVLEIVSDRNRRPK